MVYRTDAAAPGLDPHRPADADLDLVDVHEDDTAADDAEDWLDGWIWQLGPEPGAELARD